MQIVKSNQKNNKEYALVVGVFEDQKEVRVNEKIDQEINKLISNKLINTKLGNVSKVFTFGKIENEVVFIIGLGKKAEYSNHNLERAAREINKKLYERLAVVVDTFMGELEPKEVMKKLLLTIDYYDYS